MFKRVKDIAVIVKDGLKEGARNLSGKLDEYFDGEMKGMLSECRTQAEAVEKEQVLLELVICRDRIIRAEKQITVYGSLYVLLVALECVLMSGGLNGILGRIPGWIVLIALVVETFLFWALIGKQYRSKRRCSMKAEMLLDQRGLIQLKS